jgi:uncharacterized alpha/beta hydrolase family protein
MVAHSMGTVGALYFLNKMSQNYKDDTIAQFVAIGAPFMGATKVKKKNFLNFKNNFAVFKLPIGRIQRFESYGNYWCTFH